MRRESYSMPFTGAMARSGGRSAFSETPANTSPTVILCRTPAAGGRPVPRPFPWPFLGVSLSGEHHSNMGPRRQNRSRRWNLQARYAPAVERHAQAARTGFFHHGAHGHARKVRYAGAADLRPFRILRRRLRRLLHRRRIAHASNGNVILRDPLVFG